MIFLACIAAIFNEIAICTFLQFDVINFCDAAESTTCVRLIIIFVHIIISLLSALRCSLRERLIHPNISKHGAQLVLSLLSWCYRFTLSLAITHSKQIILNSAKSVRALSRDFMLAAVWSVARSIQTHKRFCHSSVMMR